MPINKPLIPLLLALICPLMSAALPAWAGPQPLPPVTPVGPSRPAMPVAGIGSSEHSASIEWNGDHVVYLSVPGTGYAPRIVRLSSSGSAPVPGSELANASQPNYLAARRIGSMVYLGACSGRTPVRSTSCRRPWLHRSRSSSSRATTRPSRANRATRCSST